MNKQQHGMTLIELMISLVLGLGVIAGVSSLFLQMQKSGNVQRSLGAMADDSGYVQEILQKEIRRTGGLRSRSDVNGTNDKLFVGGAIHTNLLNSGINLGASEYVKGYVGIVPTPPDALIIRYQLVDATDLSVGGNSSSPCTQNVLLNAGEDPAQQEHVVSVYLYLNGGTLTCTAQREVFDIKNGIPPTCVGNCANPGSTTNFAPSDAGIALVGNVAGFALSYGVDPDGDGAANYYVDAATVPVANWQNVISVRLSLVLRSADDHLTDTIVPYPFNGASVTPTDHRLYKAFTTTIALRNQIQ
jgi:type IV pilus assembly protein PilW